MRVLVVGSGAREHAIAWRLSQSPGVDELLVAPGNAGTARIARNVPIRAADVEGLAALAGTERVDLTVVGPEGPLAAGITDRFLAAGHLIFGPTRGAARIESSKAFAKELMVRHRVPTGSWESFGAYADAVRYVADRPLPVVVKADGLAAGKGVTIAETLEEAVLALRRGMVEREFGEAGERVLIEEYLEGREVSVFAFVDGEYVSPLVAACDYKRVGEGDVGPNTGGMGGYGPPPAWTEELERRVRAEVMEPVARALVAEGSPYSGVLYAGLILTADGIRVLEFNCRLGDPEAQVILPRLKSDLAAVMMGTAQGNLAGVAIEWEPSACVGVVVASGGYPGSYRTGYPVSGLEELDRDVLVFHAGTREEGAQVVTDGGRVLTVASLGGSLAEARQRVYDNVGRVRFEGSFFRRDIAAALDH